MGNSHHDRIGQSLNQEDFELLLGWLDSNLEYAGRKYEEIRRKLIKIFSARGCMDAEDLTDETINRVAHGIKGIRPTYSGDPALYFYGVAQQVHLEYSRRSSTSTSIPPFMADTPPVEIEIEYECLEKCMQSLSADNRKLILQYYQEEKRAKIDARKNLAAQLGIPLNALRIRAHRIRATLHECVQACMNKQNSGIS
jgi:RNA polymerase sigma factor (sigma-70 family)